jgi:hypothetical protein
MIKHLHTAIVLAGLLMPLVVMAQEDQVEAAVDISTRQNQKIWAGQQVTINLDLKTTGYSFSTVLFNLPQVSNAFLMQTDTTTIKLSENTDGRTWQILRYPLALYPLQAGRLEIPAITVRFATSAGFGSDEEAFELQTEALRIIVSLPPGVREDELLVTTSSFEIDYDWQPAATTASTGDAFTLTVNRRADDISAMLLPPLPVFRTDGLAAYPQAPEVNDKTSRGDLTGERKDTIIWVAEKAGVYEIPGIRFQWWDPDNQELRQQIVPGLDLEILPSVTEDALEMAGENTAGDSRDELRVLSIVLAGILAVFLWWRFGLKTRKQNGDSEKFAFASLLKACKSNHAAQTYTAIHAWLGYVTLSSSTATKPVTLDTFARAWDDEKLATELDQLQKAVTSRDSSWTGRNLVDSLRRVRRKISNNGTSKSRIHIDPLNPQAEDFSATR